MKVRNINLNKEHILHQLSNAGTVFMLGWVSETFFENDLSIGYLKEHGYSESSLDYFKFLNDSVKKERAFRGFKHSHWRALIKESFEVIKDFCNDNNLFDKLRNQDWYEFVRLLRNGISHDFRFDFSRYNQNQFPITWKTISINYDLDGEFIPSSLLSHEIVIDIFENMRKFIMELDD